jgi:hypothetical protein
MQVAGKTSHRECLISLGRFEVSPNPANYHQGNKSSSGGHLSYLRGLPLRALTDASFCS